jgi:hypothetical protein
MNERNCFLRRMFSWGGFKSIGLEFERNKRFVGESHAHFSHVFQMAIQGIFAYSYFPLKLISICFFTLSGSSLIYLLYTFAKIGIKGVPFTGYGTILSLIIFMFGFLFLLLGILAQYITQIYDEVRARPHFIVKEEIGFE